MLLGILSFGIAGLIGGAVVMALASYFLYHVFHGDILEVIAKIIVICLVSAGVLGLVSLLF